MIKIGIITDTLSKPIDEGFKKVGFRLIEEFSKENEVLAICGSGDGITENNIEVIPTNRLLISHRLMKRIKYFNPDFILYIPFSSASIYSFLRSKILKFYHRKSRIVMIALQPREYTFLQKAIIPLLKPDLILTPSPQNLKILYQLHCRVEFIPLGVDIQIFTPIKEDRKKELREKYELPMHAYILLHIAQLDEKRNLKILKLLQKGNNQVVIVGSTSPPEESPIDNELVEDLRQSGIKVIIRYIKNIEEIYQLSDCYVFPTTSQIGCIGIPLSILEAMSCNLPIITTKYEGLPYLFQEKDGFFYVDDPTEFEYKVNIAKKVVLSKTREMVKKCSWKNIAKIILSKSTQ